MADKPDIIATKAAVIVHSVFFCKRVDLGGVYYALDYFICLAERVQYFVHFCCLNRKCTTLFLIRKIFSVKESRLLGVKAVSEKFRCNSSLASVSEKGFQILIFNTGKQPKKSSFKRQLLSSF